MSPLAEKIRNIIHLNAIPVEVGQLGARLHQTVLNRIFWYVDSKLSVHDDTVRTRDRTAKQTHSAHGKDKIKRTTITPHHGA